MRVFIYFLFCIASLYSLKSQTPSYVPTNGLIGWWGFNGNANDGSGNGHNGSNSNATLTTDRNNIANAAYSFNGTNSKIEVNANTNFDIQKLTISAWIYSTQSVNQKYISKSNWANAGSETFSLYMPGNGEFAFNTKYQSNCIAGNGWLTPIIIARPADFFNYWHHIVVTYDNVIAKFYIDGCLIKESTSTFPIDICSGGQLKFGAWLNSDPAWFKGKLDDIGLWNRALTESEVKSLYSGANPMKATFPGNYTVSCNGSKDGIASVVVQGGISPYSFTWNTMPTQTTQTAYALPPGTYTVIVTDSKCQTASASVVITEPNTISASVQVDNNVSCKDGSDGKATISIPIGGSPPYSYEWNTDPIQKTQSALNLPAGKYTATIKDSKGCSTILTANISEPNAPLSNVEAVAVQHISCYGDSTGIVTVISPNGGSPPYMFNWYTSPIKTTQTISNLPAGKYKVIVADSKGCFVTSIVELKQPEKELSDIEFEIIKEINCNGNKIGSIGIKNPQGGTPPYTFTWNTDSVQNTQVAKNLGSGKYLATVRDKNNCTRSRTIELKEPTQVNVDVKVLSHASCYDKKDGVIYVSAFGGTPPYKYLWSTIPTQFSDTIKFIGAGEYFVSVVDSKGCMVVKSIVLNQPDSVELPQISTFLNKTYICKGDSRGIFVSSRTKYQSYDWIFNGDEIPEFKNKDSIYAFLPGEYKLKSTKNACTYESNLIIIEERDLPKPIIRGKMIVESGEENVEYQTSYTRGSTYKWFIDGKAKIVTRDDSNKIKINYKSIELDSIIIRVLETDSNECIKDTSFMVKINKATDIDVVDENAINYNVNRLNVSTYEYKFANINPLLITSVELYDIMGRKLSQIQKYLTNDTLGILAEGIESGIYLLVLRTNTMVYNCTLIVD